MLNTIGAALITGQELISHNLFARPGPRMSDRGYNLEAAVASTDGRHPELLGGNRS